MGNHTLPCQQGVHTPVALLSLTCFAALRVLLDFGPQGLVDGSRLAWNTTGHLGGKFETGSDISVGSILQENPVTAFAMRKGVLTDKVQGIAVRQLRRAQGVELCGVWMQFELGRYHLFHACYGINYSTACQKAKMVERTRVPRLKGNTACLSLSRF